MRRTRPQIVAVLGPTAVGKSAFAAALAADLAEQGCAAEIIVADALQVYRGLDIGTAKPGPRERSRVRHHLVDVLEPHQTFSAGDFARRARTAVKEIEGRGRLPILVGGAGFYLRALFEGLAPVPPVPLEVRSGLRNELSSVGLDALFEELRTLDPESAASLSAGDTQRVLRALEVIRFTGRTLSSWHREGSELALDRQILKVGLTLPRALLYDAIETRARDMLDRGWLDEVRRLQAPGGAACGRSWHELPACQAIGYRQFADHLDGKSTLEQALEETIRNTRRYAKRQQTWFRRETDVCWIDVSRPGDVERTLAAIVAAHVAAKSSATPA